MGSHGHEMPASTALAILSLEYLIHAWDFAQAFGAQVEVSPEVAQYVHDLGEQIIPGGRERGSFGPATDAGERASVLERLIALSGRTA